MYNWKSTTIQILFSSFLFKWISSFESKQAHECCKHITTYYIYILYLPYYQYWRHSTDNACPNDHRTYVQSCARVWAQCFPVWPVNSLQVVQHTHTHPFNNGIEYLAERTSARIDGRIMWSRPPRRVAQSRQWSGQNCPRTSGGRPDWITDHGKPNTVYTTLQLSALRTDRRTRRHTGCCGLALCVRAQTAAVACRPFNCLMFHWKTNKSARVHGSRRNRI